MWKPDAYEPEQPVERRSAAAIDAKQTAEELEELEDECGDDRALEAYRWAPRVRGSQHSRVLWFHSLSPEFGPFEPALSS